MNLAETQRLLWDLLHGRERPLDAFFGSPDLPAAERVAIYTRMFVDRQVDALRETFPPRCSPHWATKSSIGWRRDTSTLIRRRIPTRLDRRLKPGFRRNTTPGAPLPGSGR